VGFDTGDINVYQYNQKIKKIQLV